MAQFQVTSADDISDANDGVTTLREAVELANAAGEASTITFADGLDGQTIRLTQGEIEVTETMVIDADGKDIKISGDAEGDDILDANGFTDIRATFSAGDAGDNSRIFNHTDADSTLTLKDLGLTGGFTFGFLQKGGAIQSEGHLVLDGAQLVSNGTSGPISRGGAVNVSDGSLTMLKTLVAENITRSNDSEGGGVSVEAADVTISHSSFVNNETLNRFADGGALAVNFFGADIEALIQFSTFAGNSVFNANAGAILMNTDAFRIENTTITGNFAAIEGGGVFFEASRPAGSDPAVVNTIISGNLSNTPEPEAAAQPFQIRTTASAPPVAQANLMPDENNVIRDSENSNDLVGLRSNTLDSIGLANTIIGGPGDLLFAAVEDIDTDDARALLAGVAAMPEGGGLPVVALNQSDGVSNPALQIGNGLNISFDGLDIDGDGDKDERIDQGQNGVQFVPETATFLGSDVPTNDVVVNRAPEVINFTLNVTEAELKDGVIVNLQAAGLDPDGDDVVVDGFQGAIFNQDGDQRDDNIVLDNGLVLVPTKIEGQGADGEVFGFQLVLQTREAPDGNPVPFDLAEDLSFKLPFTIRDIPQFGTSKTDDGEVTVEVIAQTGDGTKLTAVNDQISGSEDDASISILNILGNDFNPPDGGDLRVTAFGGVALPENAVIGEGALANGARFVFDETGSVQIQLDGAFDGLTDTDAVETFTYTVQNEKGETSSAQVEVTIQAVDDPAQITPQEITARAGEPGSFTADEALQDDNTRRPQDVVDKDNNVFDFDATGEAAVPGVGTVSIVDGVVTVTPDEGLPPGATEELRISFVDDKDPFDEVDIPVTIKVVDNEAPDAVDDPLGVFLVNTSTGALQDAQRFDEEVFALTQNDSDPEGDLFVVTAINGADVAADRTDEERVELPNGVDLTLVPTSEFGGTQGFELNVDQVIAGMIPGTNQTVTFTYTITDINGGTDTATASFILRDVVNPVEAFDDEASIRADEELLSLNLLQNDTIPNGPGVVTELTQFITTLPLNQSTESEDGSFVLLRPDGSLSYSTGSSTSFQALADGEVGFDVFKYTVQDATGNTDEASVTIEITGVNDAPEAEDAAVTAKSGEALSIVPKIFDPDSSDILTVTVLSEPENGTLTQNLLDNTFTYTPKDNFFGRDTITYEVADESGETATATITINVTSGDGDKKVVLPGGENTVKNTLGGHDGSEVDNFNTGDVLKIADQQLGREDFTDRPGSAILEFDTDRNGEIESTVTLSGDFSDGDFMAAFDGRDTRITFHELLPTLTEAQAVGTQAVNGVTNIPFLTGANSDAFRVTLEPAALADNDNALGVYEVTANGTIVDVRLLFDGVKGAAGATAIVADVDADHSLGFFIVQDGADFAKALGQGDTLSFVGAGGDAAHLDDGAQIALAVNGVVAGETVFHSVSPTFNPGGLQHALSGVAPGGDGMFIGFEDQSGGGDLDYQDVLFLVETLNL